MNIYRVSSLLLARTLCFRIFEFVHFVLVSLLFNDFFEMRSLRWLLFNWIYWVVLRGYLYLVLSRRLVLCFSGGGCSFWPSSLFGSLAGVFLFWYFCWHRLIRSSQKSTTFHRERGRGHLAPVAKRVFCMRLCCCCQVVGSAFVVTVCGEKYS